MAVHRPDRDEQLRKFEQLNREAAELLAELTEPRDIADVEMHKALAMSAIAGSGWEPPAEPSFTLDRAQRAALRRELGVRAYECSDVSLHFDNGNRAAVIRNLEMMGPLVAVMDMIGWPSFVPFTIDWILPCAQIRIFFPSRVQA